MDEATLLKHVLGAIIDDSPGIYPKAIRGTKDGYEKRTEWQEGWNAGVMACVDLVHEILTDLGVHVYDGDNCIDVPEIKYS